MKGIDGIFCRHFNYGGGTGNYDSGTWLSCKQCGNWSDDAWLCSTSCTDSGGLVGGTVGDMAGSGQMLYLHLYILKATP